MLEPAFSGPVVQLLHFRGSLHKHGGPREELVTPIDPLCELEASMDTNMVFLASVSHVKAEKDVYMTSTKVSTSETLPEKKV